MNPGDLVVAKGGFNHVNKRCTWQFSHEGLHCQIERWSAKLYPYANDWGTPAIIDHGTLGLVLCRLKPTGMGREWRRVLVVSSTMSNIGWMCQGDGWVPA
jgi:hypothetical protein